MFQKSCNHFLDPLDLPPTPLLMTSPLPPKRLRNFAYVEVTQYAGLKNVLFNSPLPKKRRFSLYILSFDTNP